MIAYILVLFLKPFSSISLFTSTWIPLPCPCSRPSTLSRIANTSPTTAAALALEDRPHSKTTWLVWALRVFFLDLPFPPSPVWVVLGAELGCVRAAGASFDQLPEVCGAVGVRSACDLPPGGPDRGLPPRSTSNSERWC
ncbi:hypothetical protein ACOSQ3_004438 [Xanthoceras sorbifolium]